MSGLGSWRDLPAAQQPDWPDPARLAAVTEELAGLPPLVFAGECDLLRERLAAVARGEATACEVAGVGRITRSGQRPRATERKGSGVRPGDIPQ